MLQSWGPASSVPRRAPLVFVAYGIVTPGLDFNDYFDVNVGGLAFFDTFSDLILVGGALSSIGDSLKTAIRTLDLEVDTEFLIRSPRSSTAR